MDESNALPNDLAECQRLLLAAFQESMRLEQRIAETQQQAAASQQQVAELNRVLNETEASYATLQETHHATIAELERLKRWIYGRRSERILESDGQQHLFDLQPAATGAGGAEVESPIAEVQAHQRRRRRQLDLDQLPSYRHEVPLSDQEKQCACCGRAKDRIGEDETKILDYVPPKLEVHVHVRPKYAWTSCVTEPMAVCQMAKGSWGHT